MFKPQLAKHLYKEMEKKQPAIYDKYFVFEKYDGWYGYFDCAEGVIKSRNGRVIPSLTELSHRMKSQIERESGVLIFEILVKGVTDFHTLNGILNRKDEQADAYLQVHDFVEDDTTPFQTRYWDAYDVIEDLRLPVHLAPYTIVSDDPEDWYEVCRSLWDMNKEGVILKAAEGTYAQGKRNSSMMKIKEEVTLDLFVQGIERGKGKYANTLGALIVQGADGIKHTISGMSDEERDEWWYNPDDILGQVVEVKAMKILPDGSLREPRFKAVRHDKEVWEVDASTKSK